MSENQHSMMSLREIVKNLRSFNDDETVFLDRSIELSPETPGIVVRYSEDDKAPPEVSNFKCFMDIWQIRDVLQGKARLLGMAGPNVDQQVEILMSFANNGA